MDKEAAHFESTVSDSESSAIRAGDKPSEPGAPQLENGHARRYGKVVAFFGFKKAYNFPLWVIFAGGMFGFSLRNATDFNFQTLLSNLGPGLYQVYEKGVNKYMIILHIAFVVPGGLAVVLQFTPVIRQKWITFHRLNGYFVLLLFFLSNVTVSAVLKHNQGGNRIAAQSLEALLVLLTTASMFLAWWNIRCLQIDQHRAWMLRTFFYYGAIPVDRILTALGLLVVSKLGDYYMTWSCDELANTYSENGLGAIPADLYPQCYAPNATAATLVPVKAVNDYSMPAAFGTAYNTTFGGTAWIALALVMIGIEIYLQLTPAESRRLRQVSYERQLKAGFKNPGDAGITALRWGDA